MIALNPRPRAEWENAPQGILSPPGTYTAHLVKVAGGKEKELTEPISFNVKPLHEPAEGTNAKKSEKFWDAYAQLVKSSSAMQSEFGATTLRLKAIKRATQNTTLSFTDYISQLNSATNRLNVLETRMSGSKAKREMGEKTIPSLGDRLFALYIGLSNSTYGPTKTHQDLIQWAEADVNQFSKELKGINEEIKAVAQKIVDAGCLLYTSPSPRDQRGSRMPSSA